MHGSEVCLLVTFGGAGRVESRLNVRLQPYEERASDACEALTTSVRADDLVEDASSALYPPEDDWELEPLTPLPSPVASPAPLPQDGMAGLALCVESAAYACFAGPLTPLPSPLASPTLQSAPRPLGMASPPNPPEAAAQPSAMPRESPSPSRPELSRSQRRRKEHKRKLKAAKEALSRGDFGGRVRSSFSKRLREAKVLKTAVSSANLTIA